jgi:hypothetical protein
LQRAGAFDKPEAVRLIHRVSSPSLSSDQLRQRVIHPGLESKAAVYAAARRASV